MLFLCIFIQYAVSVIPFYRVKAILQEIIYNPAFFGHSVKKIHRLLVKKTVFKNFIMRFCPKNVQESSSIIIFTAFSSREKSVSR